MCLYIKDIDGDITIVGGYVDDLLVTGTLNEVVERFFDYQQDVEGSRFGDGKRGSDTDWRRVH